MSDSPTDGMWDAEGRFVPSALIRPIDRQRHEVVTDLAARARAMSELLATFKRSALDDVRTFLDLSAELYGAALAGAKGNVTLYSFDGRFKIERAVADQLAFDERLQVAKRLIDECVTRWSEGASAEIRTLVLDAFQVDRAGRVSARRVLRLRQLDIADDQWSEAMRAISDSVRVAATKSYVRFYERSAESDVYRPILLDFAAIAVEEYLSNG